MLTALKKWIAPPVFPGSEEKSRLANLLNTILLTLIIYFVFLIGADLFGGRTPATTIYVDGVCLLLALLDRAWLRQGKVERVGLLLVVGGFIIITLANISLGTIRTPTAAAYLFLVIMSGLLFDLKGVLISAVTSSLAILGLILAENAGLLPQPDYSVTFTQWFFYTGLFGLTGGLVHYSVQATRKALAHAENEITERERAKVEQRKLMQAVEQSPVSIVVTNLEGNIEYVNPRFTQVTGYTLEEAIGQNPRILKTDQTPKETHRQLWDTLTAGKEWRGEFVNRKKDGSIYYESANISPIADSNGTVTHYVAVKEDITERKHTEEALQKAYDQLRAQLIEIKELQAELRSQAVHDSLTGLYNRRYLDEALAREVARSERENAPLSVIICDIDHFKEINDAYGHQVGDKFLVQLAALMEGCVRGSDIVSRFGGEEFVLILPGATIDFAEKRAEEIRLKVEELVIQHEEKNLHVTMSFGVAVYPLHGKWVDEVIVKADKALYQSKQVGRNRVTVWSEAPDGNPPPYSGGAHVFSLPADKDVNPKRKSHHADR